MGVKVAAYVLAGLAVLVVGFALWVRLAPSQAARWHVAPPEVPGRFAGGVVEVLDGDAAGFARLAQIIAETPRTRLLAGSFRQRRLTYITRSAVWGFPDYTTIAHADGRITIHARLRFGRSDLGVNAARVRGWLERLDAVQQ